MDPTSNLPEQLMLARRLVAIGEAVARLQESDDSVAAADAIKRLAAERTEAADLLAELILALDEWQNKAGVPLLRAPRREERGRPLLRVRRRLSRAGQPLKKTATPGGVGTNQ